MAGYNFIRPDRDPLFLMPPALQHGLPSGDLAYFVLDAVDQFDLAPFQATYRADGVGQAAFQPPMMVARLLDAYCLGVRSSRQRERLCERDLACRVVAGNLRPDHAPIARFRQRHGEALKGLFTDLLRLCKEAGLVKVGVVALDGTQNAADAALEVNRTSEAIRAEVEAMLRQAESTDVQEDRLYGPDHRGDELPEALRERRGRLERLKRCRERLEREAAAVAADHAPKSRSEPPRKPRPVGSCAVASPSRCRIRPSRRRRPTSPPPTAGSGRHAGATFRATTRRRRRGRIRSSWRRT